MVGFKRSDIAPCGINCGRCRAHLRALNPCEGCRSIVHSRRKACEACVMRTCTKRKGRFCFDCAEYPCAKLRHLDQRYRLKYGMSEIANLEFIRKSGLLKFLDKERAEAISPRGVLCVHDKKRYRPLRNN